MFKSRNFNFTFLLFLFFLSGAIYADDLRLGEPDYGGNGCPFGSAEISLDSDGKSLKVLFNDFALRTRLYKTLARKSCNLSIPLHLPEGLSVSIVEIDYQGFMFLPQNSMARFSSEFFFSGEKGIRLQKHFFGGYQGTINLKNHLFIQSQQWSSCGGDMNLRLNTNLFLKSKKNAFISFSSMGVKSGVTFGLKWKSCY